VWQRRKQTAAAPAEELSAWIVDVSSAWLLLANDATETVKFTRRLPGSSPADSGADSGTDGGGEADGAAAPSNANEQTLEAGGRQWVRSPFQVPRLVECCRRQHMHHRSDSVHISACVLP